MPASKPRFSSFAFAGRRSTHRGLRKVARASAVLGIVAPGVLLSAPADVVVQRDPVVPWRAQGVQVVRRLEWGP